MCEAANDKSQSASPYTSPRNFGLSFTNIAAIPHKQSFPEEEAGLSVYMVTYD